MIDAAPERSFLGGYDGYGAIEVAAKSGWRAVSAWGRDGWDLGSWPLVIVFMRERDGRFEVSEYVEGDLTTFRFDTEVERTLKTNDIAFWWWQTNREPWVEGLDEPKPEHRGPFTWERLARERA